jgi:hypothetical protein
MIGGYNEILMGNFWGSIHLRTDDRERIGDILRELARSSEVRFLLTAVNNGWITVYPSENGQDFSLSDQIASYGHWFVVHLINHDDSQFAYRISRSGKLLDEYVSVAGYFSESDREREQDLIGRPELFEEILIRPLSDVRRILKRDEEGSLLAADQMEDFAAALGIKHVATAYEYLEEGEPSGIKGRRKFERIPDKGIEKQKTAEKKRAEKARLDQLMKEGALLGYYRAHKDRHLWSARHPNGLGFLLKETRNDGKQAPMLHLAPPWKKTVKVTEQPFADADLMTLSKSGLYAVVSKRTSADKWWDHTTELWDLNAMRAVRKLEVNGQFEFSPDDRRLLVLEHNKEVQVRVLSISNGSVVKTIQTKAATGLAIHPSNSAILINEQTKLRIVNLQDSSERDIYLGGKSALASAVQHMFMQKLQAMDLDKLRRDSERETEKQIASLERKFQQSKGMCAFDEKVRDKMRRDMEAAMEGQIKTFENLKSQKSKIPQQAAEGVACMKFSVDGSLLFCGTGNGLRVYCWKNLVEGPEDVTRVEFSFTPTIKREDGYEYPAHIYALQEDVERQRLLFGGMDGVLYIMNLCNGSVNQLHVMPQPQHEIIQDIQLSSDGETIACRCMVGWGDETQKPGYDAPILYVWRASN